MNRIRLCSLQTGATIENVAKWRIRYLITVDKVKIVVSETIPVLNTLTTVPYNVASRERDIGIVPLDHGYE